MKISRMFFYFHPRDGYNRAAYKRRTSCSARNCVVDNKKQEYLFLSCVEIFCCTLHFKYIRRCIFRLHHFNVLSNDLDVFLEEKQIHTNIKAIGFNSRSSIVCTICTYYIVHCINIDWEWEFNVCKL